MKFDSIIFFHKQIVPNGKFCSFFSSDLMESVNVSSFFASPCPSLSLCLYIHDLSSLFLFFAVFAYSLCLCDRTTSNGHNCNLISSIVVFRTPIYIVRYANGTIDESV